MKVISVHSLNYGVTAIRVVNKSITDGANGFNKVSHICEGNGRDNTDFMEKHELD